MSYIVYNKSYAFLIVQNFTLCPSQLYTYLSQKTCSVRRSCLSNLPLYPKELDFCLIITSCLWTHNMEQLLELLLYYYVKWIKVRQNVVSVDPVVSVDLFFLPMICHFLMFDMEYSAFELNCKWTLLNAYLYTESYILI